MPLYFSTWHIFFAHGAQARGARGQVLVPQVVYPNLAKGTVSVFHEPRLGATFFQNWVPVDHVVRGLACPRKENNCLVSGKFRKKDFFWQKIY
jgi:hypothetical protein